MQRNNKRFDSGAFGNNRCVLDDVGVYNSIAKAVGTLNIDFSTAKFKKLLQTIFITIPQLSKPSQNVFSTKNCQQYKKSKDKMRRPWLETKAQ